MKKTLLLSLLALSFCAAHADDFTVGATVGDSYHTQLLVKDGANSITYHSNSSATPLKLYGGYTFTDTFGIEAGYKDFSKTTIDPNAGSGDTLSSKSHAFYLAGKGTVHLGVSWSLFGKLGVANTQTRFDGSGLAAGLTSNVHRNGLYASAGAAYLLTKNLAITLELEHFGAATVTDKNLKFGMNGVAAGVNYSF